MSVTDPIADMITRMRNAARIKRREVQMPSSKLKVEIAKILKDEGYLKNFKVLEDKKQGTLVLTLKYTEGNQSVVTGSRRVSKPGCRIYCTSERVPKVLDGLGLAVISTSRGIASGKKCEELGLGGEVLCYIW
ncbi:MAG: 30S ribosomal protein S8 [Candidatus Aminicenantales bacterium]|jgi:small subunit ribosomal protein S8